MLVCMKTSLIVVVLLVACSSEREFVSREDACTEQSAATCGTSETGCRTWYEHVVCSLEGAPFSAVDQDACMDAILSQAERKPILGIDIPTVCSELWLTGHRSTPGH